jgi:hypothetical protein
MVKQRMTVPFLESTTVVPSILAIDKYRLPFKKTSQGKQRSPQQEKWFFKGFENARNANDDGCMFLHLRLTNQLEWIPELLMLELRYAFFQRRIFRNTRICHHFKECDNSIFASKCLWLISLL